MFEWFELFGVTFGILHIWIVMLSMLYVGSIPFIWDDWEQVVKMWKKNPSEVIALIFIVPPVVVIGFPLVLFFMITEMTEVTDGFKDGYEIYSKFFNYFSDYIAIFMPVLCVLTLFLLN